MKIQHKFLIIRHINTHILTETSSSWMPTKVFCQMLFKTQINRMWECSFEQRHHLISSSALIQSKQRYISIIWIRTKSHLTGHRAYIEPAASVCALYTQTLAQMSLCVLDCVCMWALLRLRDMKKKKKKELWIMHESLGQCIVICFKEAFSQPL